MDAIHRHAGMTPYATFPTAHFLTVDAHRCCDIVIGNAPLLLCLILTFRGSMMFFPYIKVGPETTKIAEGHSTQSMPATGKLSEFSPLLTAYMKGSQHMKKSGSL